MGRGNLKSGTGGVMTNRVMTNRVMTNRVMTNHMMTNRVMTNRVMTNRVMTDGRPQGSHPTIYTRVSVRSSYGRVRPLWSPVLSCI